MITAPLDPNAIPFEAGMMIGHNSNPPQRVVSARGGGAILKKLCVCAPHSPCRLSWNGMTIRSAQAQPHVTCLPLSTEPLQQLGKYYPSTS